MERAWFLGDCYLFQGVEGCLAVHRKTREQGGWLKSLGGFGKGLARPLDKVGRRDWLEVQWEEGGEGGRFGMVQT